MDFLNPADPKIKPFHFNLDKYGYSMLIIDTGGDHSSLTDDYTAIRKEMNQVAEYFGSDVLRGISLSELYSCIPQLRTTTGDRALLRSIHYLSENQRVNQLTKLLENMNILDFLNIINESGNSSSQFLQNGFSLQNVRAQGIMLGLAITKNFLQFIQDGATRIHGGGFQGTIQTFIPKIHVHEYKKLIGSIFGEKATIEPQIQKIGVTALE